MFRKMFFSGYAAFAYAASMAVLLYTMGFLLNFAVPKGIDDGQPGPVLTSVAFNAGLILLLGLQHSVMARLRFKAWWIRIVPQPIERATYLLATCLALGLLFWLWRPLPDVIWDLDAAWARAALYGLYAGGWLLMLAASFNIDHFELLGLRQVYDHVRNRAPETPGFKVTWLYALMRHPISTAHLVVSWTTPTMSQGHLLYALLVTLYIAIATVYEERDLRSAIGSPYDDYRRRVRAFLPIPKRSRH